jgi:serine/threonine-protein kinase
LTSTKYEEVSGDWWAAFAPGVARDERSPLLSATPVDLATRAEDKLAAAWASLNDGARDRETAATPSPLPEFPEWPLAGETELLPSPPPRGAPSSDFDDFFNEAPARTPTAARDDAPGAPFAATVAVVETAVDNRFEAAAPRPAAVSTGGHAAPNFSPGSRVGRFGIEAMIGKGGMGEVYRARLTGEAGFRRVVVLKRLAINLKHDPEALRMFTAEAEVAARIAHPNVVQIFDVQTQGDEPFMVMEHLEGLSLLKLSQKARAAGIALDRPVLIRCALDAARGLHAAHSMRGDDGNLAGLVHRDVSPDNLFLCTNGFTKLLDFGIARRNDLTTRTRGNELKGKIPYMSPEQILGERLDGRSDLFSLGSTLYQLLSGQRPFAGENDVTTLFAVVHKPHVPVHAVIDDAGDLGNVVERLLQKRASDRPSSALEVVEALERASPATPEAAAAFLARVWEA